MKRYILPSVILFAVVIFLPSMGLAINSGAHIYVTEQVFGSDDVDLLYGSIAPDLSLYVPDVGSWTTGFMDTHYNYIILWPQGWTEPWKRFTMGWMVHNEAWGADFYSHIEYEYPDGTTVPGYVVHKAAILAPNIPIPNPVLQMLIAHNAIEFAIDLLVQEYLDPDLGMDLYQSAVGRSDEDVRRLFNILVAKGKVTDRETLFQSETTFRELILLYSPVLAASDLGNMWPLAQLGAVLAYELYGAQIPVDQVHALLQASVALCIGDYEQFISDTIEGIKNELDQD